MKNEFIHVIPGCAILAQASDVQLHIGESILPVVVMDSGLALRAPRNDGLPLVVKSIAHDCRKPMRKAPQ